MTIGILWLNYHRLFTLIRRTDDRPLIFNGLLRLAVTIVPLPTPVLAAYLRSEHGRAAAGLYSLHGLIIVICYNLLWRHAAVGHRLLGKRIPHQAAQDITHQYRWGPIAYILVVGASQLNANLAVGLCIALTLFFAVPPAALRHSANPSAH